MFQPSNFSKYVLMHRDIETGVVTIDNDTDALLKWDLFNKDHAPLGAGDVKAFSNWIQRRAIPKHQKNQEVLRKNKTGFAYMMENLGLSLIDNYWLKPIGSDYTWEKVNLYQNSFTEIDFSFSDIDNASLFKPSATTQGELQKRWAILNGERVLIKGNHSAMYRQSINECFASLLHKKQGKFCVHYDLIELPTTLGSGFGCISKNFTTEDMEFVPAYDVTFCEKQPGNVSVLEHYIRTCAKYGIDEQKMRDTIDYLILSDFLLTNTDRHLLNLGILRNPVTLRFVSPAPIFDTGNSMFYDRNYSESTVLDVPITSFYQTELKMLEHVQNRKALDLDAVPTVEELEQLYSKDPYSVVYLPNLKEGYEKKIELLHAFQKGYSLNKRSSNYYKNITEPSSDDWGENER